jgi:RHS repeat-associated protein
VEIDDGLTPAVQSSNLMLASGNLDEIFAQVNTSATTSYLLDGGNSTAALTSSSAAITANYYYSPYGNTAQTGTATTPYNFTGRENDNGTGLYYYRARYYSPQLGRFVSEDPVGLVGGTNFYAYVQGNPISYRDPLGLLCDPHFYSYTAQSACSPQVLFDLLKLPGNTAPGSPAAIDGLTKNIVLTGQNPIAQYVSSRTMTIINVTQWGHRYYPGTVTLQVTPEPNGSRISVVGTGSGAHPYENDILGWSWFSWDIQSLAKYCVPSLDLLPAL